MIRSELVQKIADENPHLYQRDVERIVSTVFEEITSALARGDRVELRIDEQCAAPAACLFGTCLTMRSLIGAACDGQNPRGTARESGQ